MGLDDLSALLKALSPVAVGTLPNTADDTLARYVPAERLSWAVRVRDRFGLTATDLANAHSSPARMVRGRLDNEWRPLWAPAWACRVQLELIAYEMAGIRIGIAPWRVGPTDDPLPVFRLTAPGQPPERARVRRPIAATPYHDCAYTTGVDPDGFIRCGLCRRVYHEIAPVPGRLVVGTRRQSSRGVAQAAL